MAVGQLRTIVVDCADPVPLANFWCTLLGTEVHHRRDDWISLQPVGNEFCFVHEPDSEGP